MLALMGALAPLLAWSTMLLREEVATTQARYQHEAAELAQLTARMEQVERRLRLLTSSVPAVEQEVRRTLRMVRPGEHLVLFQYERDPDPR
jgi:cell division protein FtsB